MEEIFGEIEDETDQTETKIRKNEKGEVICDGDVVLAEALKYSQTEIPVGAEMFLNRTLSGLILDKLHRFPKEGERVEFTEIGIEAVVVNMTEEIIDKVKIAVVESGEGES